MDPPLWQLSNTAVSATPLATPQPVRATITEI
jgi:hypothetical protein